MVFGDSTKFAIEVALEPNPSARFMGKEPLGRIRAWVGGKPFGTWEEPSCPFGALADELREKGQSDYFAWHPSLEAKTAEARFQALDELLYHPDSTDRIFSSLDSSSILTNTVDCFDGVKVFALTPRDGVLQVLISDQFGGFAETVVDRASVSTVASELNGLDSQ